MVGAIGFEFWGTHSLNNIEARRATVKAVQGIFVVDFKDALGHFQKSNTNHGKQPSIDEPAESL
jgi:hypothetical protein